MAAMIETFSLIYLKGIVMAMRKEVEGYIELSGDRKKKGVTVTCVCVCVCVRRNSAMCVDLEKLSVCLSVRMWSESRRVAVPDKIKAGPKKKKTPKNTQNKLKYLLALSLTCTSHLSTPSPLRSPRGFSPSSSSFNASFLLCRPAHLPHGQIQVQEQPLHPSALAVRRRQRLRERRGRVQHHLLRYERTPVPKI